jgi:hypothetical protein
LLARLPALPSSNGMGAARCGPVARGHSSSPQSTPLSLHRRQSTAAGTGAPSSPASVSRAGGEGVAEPPKIIPYYRLSLPTWSLRINKELLCRFCRVKPGESLTTGSRYALSPHGGGTRVQHYIT